MHTANKFGHEYINILAQQFMWGIFDQLCDFSITMFNHTNVGPLARDDDNPSDSVVAVFLFLGVVVQFGTVQNVTLDDAD